MITILSHMVFWPALIWNMILWPIVLKHGINRRNIWGELKALGVSLAALLIPGVYLFGVW